MITLNNKEFTASISEIGADVQKITRKKDGRSYLIVDPEGKYWEHHAPVLFPAIGRSNEEQYQLNKTTYTMPQHGLVLNAHFEVDHQTADSVTLKQTSDAETISKFPFEYALKVTYTLTETGLKCEFNIENNSRQPMPYAIGHHPSFQLYAPLEDYRLTLTGAAVPMQRFGMGPVPFRDGTLRPMENAFNNKITLSHELMDGGLMIIDTPEAQYVTLASADGSHHVSITLNDFPYVGIWTKEHQQAPFLCVEPFAGLPDTYGKPVDWAHKPGNNVLDAESSCRFSYNLTLD